MFNCNKCGIPCGPRVSPILNTIETREVKYLNGFDEDGDSRVGVGVEIAVEEKLCPSCAGVSLSLPRVTDHSASVGLGLSLQGHGRKCSKIIADCPSCTRAVKHLYPSLPLPAVQHLMNEQRVHTGRLTLCSLLVGSMMDRTMDNPGRKQSKRQAADFSAAASVLQAYERRGGRES